MVDKKQYLFDNRRNIKVLLYALYSCCGALFILDFVIHRHVTHSWEGLLGFYAVYGFVGCVALVIISKWLRTVLMRDDDYYTKDAAPSGKNDGGTDVAQ